MQLLSPSHHPGHFARAPEGALLPVAPSFARAGGYEVFPNPFRERLRVVHTEPGDVELSTRLTLVRLGAPALVHWEVARDARFQDIERYGLFFAHEQLDYQLRVALTGLSPGRGYWARLWAGGSWSPTVRVHTESYAARVALARAKRALGPVSEASKRAFGGASAAESHARFGRPMHPVLRGVVRVRAATARSAVAPRVSTGPADL